MLSLGPEAHHQHVTTTTQYRTNQQQTEQFKEFKRHKNRNRAELNSVNGGKEKDAKEINRALEVDDDQMDADPKIKKNRISYEGDVTTKLMIAGLSEQLRESQ